MEEAAEDGTTGATEVRAEDLTPLRTTIDDTAQSAKQAAERSGRVLELMTSGSGGYDPIEVLGDAVFQLKVQLERVETKLDEILTRLESGLPSPPSVPMPQTPVETA